MRLAEFDDLFDDVPLLIDLDRIHGGIAAGVTELFTRLLEAHGERLDARAQDVGEAQQHGQRDPLLFEIVRDLEQVDDPVRLFLVRAHDDMPIVVDVEEAGAPAFDVVQRARRIDRPARFTVGRRGFGDVGSHARKLIDHG